MATRARRPAPQRPALDALLPHHQIPGGTQTLAEYIVRQVDAGVDPVNAAASCGVTAMELQGWMRDGTIGMNRLAGGASWDTEFTPYEQDACVFADQMIKARGAHIARLAMIAEQAAHGALQRTRTVTKRQNGNVVEIVETVESTLPDTEMIRWKLERLEPQVYGSKATLNLTVTDLTDTDETADALESRLLALAEKLAEEHRPEAIETTATDGDDTDR